MMGQSVPPKSADDIKLGVVVNMPDRCVAIHRDLNRLEEWANKNLMKFQKEILRPTHGKEQPCALVHAGDQ